MTNRFTKTIAAALALPALAVAAGISPLEIDTGRTNDIEILSAEAGGATLRTTGRDPFLRTVGLGAPRPEDATVLAFEYFAPVGTKFLEVFFGEPHRPDRAVTLPGLDPAEGWVTYKADLAEDLGPWGAAGDVLRIDFGSRADNELQIRALNFRPPTAREREIDALRAAKLEAIAATEARLSGYLGSDFPARIDHVDVKESTIEIRGDAGGGARRLLDVAPYEDVTALASGRGGENVAGAGFVVEFPRYVERDGFAYDRALSKWVLVAAGGEGALSPVSHARYPENFPARNALPPVDPTTKKGLGGFSAARGATGDLKALGITSATINIQIAGLFAREGERATIEHAYQGQPFTFRRRAVESLDRTLRLCHEHDVVVAGILLVGKQRNPSDRIGGILEHPDCDPSAIYSMPDLTNAESVHFYAAVLDFLGARYSRPDAKFGRIHHFIMHNEVDAGWVWTNAGEKPALVYFDLYHKSMRLGHAILRQHNPHGKVFISLTHYWEWTSNAKFYPGAELMRYLLDYSRVEGDFEWALAHHPYPESLREPKTWQDKKARWDYETPLITFKNLEVLDAWMGRPEALFQGERRRTVWLSENGTNSRDYTDQSLSEQAAGFAYAWKKFAQLDGLDAMQWHNWFDNRNEGGLRIGLRRFPDDADDPGGKKPVWHLYEAAGTEHEDEVFAPYLETIGIDSWDEAFHDGPIPRTPAGQ